MKIFGTILFCSRNNFHPCFTLDVNTEEKLREIETLYDPNKVLRKEQEKALLYLTEQGGAVLVNLPVGYGKSLFFHLLPRVLGADKHSQVVVVISLLNIIHKDHQLEHLRKRSISACRLNICSKVDKTTDEMGPFDIDTNIDLESVRNGHYCIVLCHLKSS